MLLVRFSHDDAAPGPRVSYLTVLQIPVGEMRFR
jgi:hypothetical protein